MTKANEETELLASVARKILAADIYFGCKDDPPGTLRLDGWVDGITAEEMRLIEKILAARAEEAPAP